MKEECPSQEGMGSGPSARAWQRVWCLGLDLEEEEAVDEGDTGLKGNQTESRPLPRVSMRRPQTSGMLAWTLVLPALGVLRKNS